MISEIVEKQPETELITISTATIDSLIATLDQVADQYMKMTLEADGIKAVTLARQNMKTLRIRVEDTRTTLKAPVLKIGKRIDDTARSLTNRIIPIENYLKDQEAEHEKALEKEREAKAAAIAALMVVRQTNYETFTGQAMPMAEYDAVRKMSDIAFDLYLGQAIEDTAPARAEQARLKAEQAAEAERVAEAARVAEAEKQRIETERLAEIERQHAINMRERQRLNDEREAFELAKVARQIEDDKAERIRAEIRRNEDIARAEDDARREKDRAELAEFWRQKAERERIEADQKAEAEMRQRQEELSRQYEQQQRDAAEQRDADQRAMDEAERARIESLMPDIQQAAKLIVSVKSHAVKLMNKIPAPWWCERAQQILDQAGRDIVDHVAKGPQP